VDDLNAQYKEQFGETTTDIFGNEVEADYRPNLFVTYWSFRLMIGLAAFSFLMDFDNADRLVRAGAPSKMAWGVALGLTVTLVWLYVEILRLMSYFRD